MNQRKIRVLTISKPYVAAAYRQKFRYLAADPRFEIGLITGADWAGQVFEPFPHENYWLRTLEIGLNGKNHFHYYKGLKEAIEEFRPDILNIEEEHYSFVTYQALRIGRKIGAKCLFYTWQNIEKRYPLPFRMIESAVFRHSSYCVAGNQEAIDILRKKGYDGPAEVIPQMGADAEAIEDVKKDSDRHRKDIRARFGIPESSLLLIFAGRLVEEKGIQEGIRALEKVVVSEQDVHFLILGTGPYEEELKQLSSKLGVTSRIHWAGSVKSLDVYKYLTAADVLLLSSHTRKNWKEQFGRILVEAMLSGCVPIGSNSGEIPLVIGEAGLVHKEGEADDLASCIMTLATDRIRLKDLSMRGQRRAQEHFTNRVIANKFARIFSEVISKKN